MSEREEQYGSSLQDVYEQYKHLDKILSDREWWGTSPQGKIICDLWQTVKGTAATPQPKVSGQPCGEPVTPRLKEMLPRLLEKRERQGILTYGQSLHTWNGRDVFRDLIEELIDGIQYTMQAEMERRDLVLWLQEALDLADWAVGNIGALNFDEELHADMSKALSALQERAAKALNQKGD